ncbi:MAG: anti-sigma factor [Alphaproteobacteria bacterium]|nr:anti-sigma factor [Alphaproteobacteria bacterium]
MTADADMDALLLDYASGALPEGPALAVATMLALDPRARAGYRALEAAGGALLAALEPQPVSAGLRDATLARLDESPATPLARPPSPAAGALPAPLRRYAPDGLDGLRWTRWGKSVQEAVLPLGDRSHRATLLRIAPGQGVLHHEHTGTEYTVVIAGGFSDDTGHYGPGDLQLCDPSVVHRPVADPDAECLCLGVLSAPIRGTGLVGRLVNPFLKF